MKKLSKFIYILFILLIGWALIASLLSNSFFQDGRDGYYIKSITYISLAIGIALIFLLRFIYKKILKAKNKTLWIISILLFIIFFALQLYTINFIVRPTWDFGIIFKEIKKIITNLDNTSKNVIYLNRFPNNRLTFMITYVFMMIFSIFGSSDLFYIKGMFFINMIFIDIAIVIMFIFLKKHASFKTSIIGLIFSILICPLYLYTPIFYSDTYSIIYPILILFIYMYILKDTKYKKTILFLIGLIASIGMNIKFTVIIILIAIIIDMFLKNKKKTFFKLVPISLIGFAISFIAITFSYKMFFGTIKIDMNKKIPYNHWIKMGLHGYGGWTGSDTSYFGWNMSFLEKEKYNNKEIKKILKNYGPLGYIKFLNKKVVFTWGDGSYYSSAKLKRSPIKRNIISRIIVADEPYNKYYLYYINGVHYAIIILMIVSAIIGIKRKNYNNLSIYLSIIGLFLFLLIWETRSRYLYNFIPLFIVLASECISELDRKVSKTCLKLKRK